MRAYWILVRRELGSYFNSLTGYVIIAGVLLLLGLSFYDVLKKLNDTPTHLPLTELFFSTMYFWWILILIPPVITMRTFAQERFSGTYETLMTTPVGDGQVVLAKFTGAWIFFLLTWLPLLGCLAVVRHHAGEPVLLDPRTTATTYLGIGLIGGLFMSMGCFSSSLTRNQIIAAMTSFALGLALVILSLRHLMEVPRTDWQGKVFAYIAMSQHMEDFVRGVVDTRHVVFYASVSLFFLWVTMKVVESRRWK
jgi:ABC-2 type transport system permease protein